MLSFDLLQTIRVNQNSAVGPAFSAFHISEGPVLFLLLLLIPCTSEGLSTRLPFYIEELLILQTHICLVPYSLRVLFLVIYSDKIVPTVMQCN